MEAHQSNLLIWIPFFPLLGAIINAFFGVKLQATYGKKAVHTIAILMPGISCLLAWIVFFQLWSMDPHHRAIAQVGWDWLHVGFVDARFAFFVDPLTSMMLLIITTIGTMIHLYATGYMAEEPAYWRFFCYLNLFVTMMLILVLGDNFLVMFIGWEGVGLASYLLIGFWYKELANAASGMKAFVVNRFGDAFFVVGLFILFWGMQGNWIAPEPKATADRLNAAPPVWSPLLPEFVYDRGALEAEHAVGPRPAVELANAEHVFKPDTPTATLNFNKLRTIFDDEARRNDITSKELWGMPLLFWVCLFFFMGATAKSAQIPFYVWLPDAMAGPTPVSALIHAATMVTAGVYMIARTNFLFILSPEACTAVGMIGAATALFAASMGLFQYDIKKVLAYSTVSQLGFMFIGVGTGAYWVGAFHLLTHACFKACLFLGSGSVILGCHHEQDMRRMGGLKKYMPATHWTYAFACFAIAGFPLAAGFCSKDEILWKAFSGSAVLMYSNYAIWAMGIMAATLTAFYMYRSYYMTFTGEYRGNDVPLNDPYPKDTARAKKLFIPEPVRGPTPEMLEALAAHGHGSHGGHGHGHDAHDSHGHDAHGAHGHDAHGGHDDHGHGGHDDHGHGHGHGPHTPHESPWTMTVPLWILGFASLFIGVIVGFPELLGHYLGVHPALEQWLHPVLEPGMTMMATYDQTRPNVSWLHDEHTKHMFEWGLAALSVMVATAGWGTARWLYKDNKNPLPSLLLNKPEEVVRIPALAMGVRQLHRLIYNKYFVDEIYYSIFVVGGKYFWNGLAWFDKNVIDGVVNGLGYAGRTAGYIQGAVDKYLVDGAVNLVADIVMKSGGQLRKLQTGQIRNYLLGAFGGAIAAFMLIIAFMS